MKKLKIAGIILISIVALFYIFFLLVLPNALDSKFAKDLINNLAKDNLGVELNIGKIKLLTSFPLNGGAEIDDLTIICNNNNKNIELKSVSAKVNLFSLLFKKVTLTDINLEGLTLSSKISKTGDLSVMKCFILPEPKKEEKTNNSSDFVMDNNFPDINIKDVNLSLFDEETKNKLSLNVDKLKLDDFVLNEHLKVNTTGKILLNDKENIVFNIKAKSFMPEIKDNKEDKEKSNEYFNFIKEFAKYNPKLNINSDIVISNEDKKIILDGFANIDDITFKIGNMQIPKSYIHIKSDKNKADIDSEFYISDKEKFNLISKIKTSKNINLELNFKTEKLSFKNLQKLATEILSTFNIENEFKNERINGYLTSDLKLVTNSKKLTTNGSLKIVNGELISDKIGLYIKEFNSNIIANKNVLNFNNTSLNINNALITLKGSIDEKANADIEINTNKLPIAKLAEAFLTGELKKNYKINNGLLDLKVIIKGKLENIKPSINLALSSLNIFDKQNKITLSNKITTANIITDWKEFKGDIVLNSTKANLADFKTNIIIPEIKLNISPDELKITNSKININSSTLNLVGDIKNYLKTPEMNFTLKGSILANDIKNFIPKEMASFVIAKGSLPIKATITGKNKFNIKGQIFANANNNLNFINIDKLQNKNTITNFDAVFENNNLNIKDVGIYIVSTNSLSDDFASNIAQANEIVIVKGVLANFNTLKNIKLNLNDTLNLDMMNISAKVNGNISADGNINNPQLRGNLNISNLNAPDYLIKNQTTNINITPSTITAQIFGLNLNGDVLDTGFTMQNNFNMPYIITKANVDAKSVDLDKLLVITSKFSSPTSSPLSSANSTLIPVTIKQGNAKIANFKVGTIEASNITSDFTLTNDVLDMKNVKSTAFKGSMRGEIKYNLNTLLMNAKLQGENMDANPAVSALLGIKDQLMGTLKFDADISMKGATLTEQLKTLKGNANFELKDGQLGSLGRIETYLKAANIMSMQIIESSINVIISTLMPYNSGQISSATGSLTFSNGNVYFSPIKSSGKEMSLFITGNLNMLNYNGDIKILGRLNSEMSEVMGALGNLSFEKIINSVPVLGTNVTKTIFRLFNATTVPSDINNIPKLTPNASSKTFKVVLSGNVMTPKGVKSFQWLTTEEVLNSTENELMKKISLPQTREDLVNELKTGLENKKQEVIKETQELTKQKINETNQKVMETKKQITDKIENNQTLKNLKTLSDFVKTEAEKQKAKQNAQ
ncbi:MAG: hypothetical protein MJ180_02595 [Candidatus Gastranaerophilales bacterium]|nr:hypothetical protein [Candidatus Gastranaerophilales bacterium]